MENFSSKTTRQRIRRGVFGSVVDLQAAINAYLAEHNASPKPFVWSKSAVAILASPTAVLYHSVRPNFRRARRALPLTWPGLHRLDRASFAWRTGIATNPREVPDAF